MSDEIAGADADAKFSFEAALRSYLESGASFADVELCVKREALQRGRYRKRRGGVLDWEEKGFGRPSIDADDDDWGDEQCLAARVAELEAKNLKLRQVEALEEMTRIAQDLGLYDGLYD